MPTPQTNNNSQSPQQQGEGKNRFHFNILWMYAILGIILFSIFFLDRNDTNKFVNYNKFEKIIACNGATQITIDKDNSTATAILKDSLAKTDDFKNKYTPGKKTHVSTIIPSVSDFSKELKDGHFNGDIVYEHSSGFVTFLWSFGPVILLIAIWIFIMRRMSRGVGGAGSIFNVGKSKAQLFDKTKSGKVTFDDVAGLSDAKTEVEEIVDFLKNPQRYTELGGKIPKGALLIGPPGTGKTLLAKAMAGEANVPFFSMSGSDFVEMFVGVGPSRVRDLFKQAKEKAPCIIFIDEIDAVGRARGKNPNFGSNDERENTLNQLLTEMDGFTTNSGIICIGATNRVDVLDKALLRAGRFDRQIFVELPDINDRIAIFKVHLRNVKVAEGLDIEMLARQTPGFSGADIANVCNEAALIAARNNKRQVTAADFNAAIDRIIGGLEKKNKITTSEEKHSIAIHEAGHATVSWHLRYGDPLVKVTIVPRGKALGAAWYTPEERQNIPTQGFLDKICSLLAGRAAEELFSGQIGIGALNDLERANKLAYSMVAYYGMSERLPNICYYDSASDGYTFAKPFSEERARVIDEEVSRIIQEQYQRALDILKEYAAGHKQLTDELYKREVIFTADVEAIFGPRKWASRSDEILAANNQSQQDDNTSPAETDMTPDKDSTDSNTETGTEAENTSNKSATPPPYNPNK